MDESGTYEAECSRKVVSGRKISARSLKFECARVLHDSLLVHVPTYGSETMIWREKERSRIRVVQMDSLRSLLGIRRMDKVTNTRINQLCGVTKVLSNGSSMWREWRVTGFAKRVYVAECAGCRSVGRPRKRWITP